MLYTKSNYINNLRHLPPSVHIALFIVTVLFKLTFFFQETKQRIKNYNKRFCTKKPALRDKNNGRLAPPPSNPAELIITLWLTLKLWLTL